ncbi:MAG TPA: response regulator [Candidatus Acidoferrum sp.]|nr:response regulator [Candidatus Acidoferrum sp.]
MSVPTTSAEVSIKSNSGSNSNSKPSSNAGGIERRRRKRAKISAQVHVRVVNSPEPFEEVCKSIDVSRDGLLFLSARAGYWKGQQLEVTFPYSTAAGALNTPQAAEVVRVESASGQHGVAVQFVAAKADAKSEKKSATNGTHGGTYAGSNGSSAYSGGGAASAADPFTMSAGTASAAAEVVKQQAVVLAVEPDQRTADIMRNILQSDGYTVIIVSDAQAALEVLRTTVPAAFIAEVEGDDMTGHDLCLIIKRNDRLRRVPVVLLTRSAQPADYSASHQLGAVVCMAKPFKPERLLHVVRLVAPPPSQKSAYGASRVSSSTIERTL